MNTRLDHIVVAAQTLEQGSEFLKEALGVEIPDGGRHDMMATHNKVMSLADDVYLELIAINSEMTLPDQPRWFGLDDPYVRASIQASPRLITWAVNSSNLQGLVESSKIPLGGIKNAQRNDLRWKVAISEDGRMPASGFMPLSIEWLTDFHPASRMQNLGCQFQSLTLFHPRKAWLANCLESIGAEQLATIEQINDDQIPYMVVTIESPNGIVSLSSKIY